MTSGDLGPPNIKAVPANDRTLKWTTNTVSFTDGFLDTKWRKYFAFSLIVLNLNEYPDF